MDWPEATVAAADLVVRTGFDVCLLADASDPSLAGGMTLHDPATTGLPTTVRQVIPATALETGVKASFFNRYM